MPGRIVHRDQRQQRLRERRLIRSLGHFDGWQKTGATAARTRRAPSANHDRIRGEFFANYAQLPDLPVLERRPREGQGQEVAIPRGYRLRPVEALQTWLAAAEVRSVSVSFACPPANELAGLRMADRSPAVVANLDGSSDRR
jgi:hypothetical protein